MPFAIEQKDLDALRNQTAHVDVNFSFASPECPGGRCGNNCSGTCAWSPCTNVAAATNG